MRTEKEILKDFENLNYDIIENNDEYLTLRMKTFTYEIRIDKSSRWYKCYWIDKRIANDIAMIEHKLLNELFEIWRWIERKKEKVSYDNSCTKKVEPSCEWYEKEVERLNIENEKLKKIVDILLEREMR